MRAAPAAAGAASGSRTRTSRCGCSARTGLPITTASAPSGGKIAEEAEGPREAVGRASRAARKRLPSGARSRGADEGVAARLEKLRAATAVTAVIQARAKARRRAPFRQAQGPEPAEGELAACEASQRAREERQKTTGKQPRGREPKPPRAGPRARDQSHFTDPESRVMSRAERDRQRAEPLPEAQRRRALAIGSSSF